MQEAGRDTSDDKLQMELGKCENKKKSWIGRQKTWKELVISPNSATRDLCDKASQNLV